MSIFYKNFKIIKTDITGNELKLKLNVAVWFYLEKEFGIKQGDWAESYQKEPALSLAKFLTSLLKANKHDVSLEEVVENVTEGDLENFIKNYMDINIEDISEKIDVKKEGK